MGEVNAKMTTMHGDITNINTGMGSVDKRIAHMERQLGQMYEPIVQLKKPVIALKDPVFGRRQSIDDVESRLERSERCSQLHHHCNFGGCSDCRCINRCRHANRSVVCVKNTDVGLCKSLDVKTSRTK